ncbi:MAG TPA: redox-regulated ATPase YchF [Anaerolineae bacterium]|nr:redox-regulated ATPase YchF [Anaerolineae bacterium]
MEVGIIGLPNAGKSTVFNAITRAGAEVAGYPFTTIESNMGIAAVPDERLYKVAKAVGCKKTIPATVKFIDIAGLVRGASRGEGLGNQFLGYIRNVDAIVHVVRCFSDENIPHVYGAVDPKEDIETINLELALADIATVERLIDRAQGRAKSGDKGAKSTLATLAKVKSALQEGTPARLLGLSEDERATLAGAGLLTDKPVIYVANVSEDFSEADRACSNTIASIAEAEGADAVEVSAKVESEIAELPKEEAEEFIRDLGLDEPGLNKVVRAAFHLLNLITFFTTESGECRAWQIKRGTKAPQAAGKIHTDMERGFIKAEVINWANLLEEGSFHSAREHGHIRLEGKDYIVQDGDVILFRFAV